MDFVLSNTAKLTQIVSNQFLTEKAALSLRGSDKRCEGRYDAATAFD